jgi:hypothetical protein
LPPPGPESALWFVLSPPKGRGREIRNRRGETMSFRKIVPAKHTPKKPVRKPVKR